MEIYKGLTDKKTTRNRTASLDRIDSSKGYKIENIQWVHKDINQMKSALENNKFIELCELVSENQRKKHVT